MTNKQSPKMAFDTLGHPELRAIIYAKERPKGFLDWGGLTELLDKAAKNYKEFGDLLDDPSEQERLRLEGETLEKVAGKLWQLHEAGVGLPERICACKQAYVQPGNQYCEGCRIEHRLRSLRDSQSKWRKKQRRKQK